MIHPTRTNLLQLREKRATVDGSVLLLKGRRQALLREFLQVAAPLMQSRDRLAELYDEAIAALNTARRHEGEPFLHAAAMAARRDFGLRVAERNLLGLRFREVSATCDPRRLPSEREYDESVTHPATEEAIDRFERIVAELFELAIYEGKVKRLGDELLRLTRRIKVMEERILPGLTGEIRTISRFLEERERESFYRLKLFKEMRQATASRNTPLP